MMADQQNPNPETVRADRQRGRQGDHQAPLADGEPRSYQAADEAAQPSPKMARPAEAAGEATRDLVDRQQQATHDMAAQWRTVLEPFLALQAETSRWLEERWRQATSLGVPSPALRAGAPFAWSAGPAFGLPAADLEETDKAYLLSVELPGLGREDMRLQVKGDMVVLSGEKAEQRDGATSAYHMSERRFGRFERKFALPADVDRAGIEAKFRDGVMVITLPKAADARAGGEIAIKAG